MTSDRAQTLLQALCQQPVFQCLPHDGVVGFKAVPTAAAQALMSTLRQQPVSFATAAGQSSVQMLKTGVLTVLLCADRSLFPACSGTASRKEKFEEQLIWTRVLRKVLAV